MRAFWAQYRFHREVGRRSRVASFVLTLADFLYGDEDDGPVPE